MGNIESTDRDRAMCIVRVVKEEKARTDGGVITGWRWQYWEKLGERGDFVSW